jgi:hypothetical protein
MDDSPVLFIRTAVRSQRIKLAASLRIIDARSGSLEWFVVLWKSEWFEVLRDDGGLHIGSDINKSLHDREFGEELEVLFEEQVFGNVSDMQVPNKKNVSLTMSPSVTDCIFA